MSFSLFWVTPIQGKTNCKVGDKVTYITTGWWASVHKFEWELDDKITKGDTSFKKTWDKKGKHKLRVREICAIIGNIAHSDWSDKIIIEVI